MSALWADSHLLTELRNGGLEPRSDSAGSQLVNDEEHLLNTLRNAHRQLQRLLDGVEGYADGPAPAYNTIRQFADGAGAGGNLLALINDAQATASRMIMVMRFGCVRDAAPAHADS